MIEKQSKKTSTHERPPIVVVMGHVDHGKSTLLDYIRNTTTTHKEVGGITQKIGAYEIEHLHHGTTKKITFIDTPGHEAFQGIRARGAKTADIAILVVSAEDGVKPQTLQALQTILAEEIPYIVAINKIDKDGADIERTKQSLAEHEIYVEGYGGTIPMVPVSAKSGAGIPELLEMILLVAELDPPQTIAGLGHGIVIETQVDKKRGNAATVIITGGSFHQGQIVVAGTSYSPIRIFHDAQGQTIKEAIPSSPVRIIGWDSLPAVGESCTVVDSKQEAEKLVATRKEALRKPPSSPHRDESPQATLPLIIKAGETGSLEAVMHEIAKITHEHIVIKVVHAGIGDISEYDVKTAASIPGTVIAGFGVGVDTPARALIDSQKMPVNLFDIIYKLSEWLAILIKERAPKKLIEKSVGRAKILKTFSRSKDKEIVGGKVEQGTLKAGAPIKIIRRDNEIGRGEIRELRKQKDKIREVEEGAEFGGLVESKIELVPGDRIECFVTVEE